MMFTLPNQASASSSFLQAPLLAPGRLGFPTTCLSSILPGFRIDGTRAGSALSAMPVSLSRTMATLYRDPDWSSKNLEPAIFEARRHVVKDKLPALFPDQLSKFQEELRQRSQEGYKVTFTDFWGLLIEACLGDEVGAQLLLGPILPWLMSSSFLMGGGVSGLTSQAHPCALRSTRHPNA